MCVRLVLEAIVSTMFREATTLFEEAKECCVHRLGPDKTPSHGGLEERASSRVRAMRGLPYIPSLPSYPGAGPRVDAADVRPGLK